MFGPRPPGSWSNHLTTGEGGAYRHLRIGSLFVSTDSESEWNLPLMCTADEQEPVVERLETMIEEVV